MNRYDLPSPPAFVPLDHFGRRDILSRDARASRGRIMGADYAKVIFVRSDYHGYYASAMTTIALDKARIDSCELASLETFATGSSNSSFFDQPAGKEHYRLLAYLSTLPYVAESGHIVDIGTYFGLSALACSYNIDNRVTTYDIYDWYEDKVNPVTARPNVAVRIKDCVNDMAEISRCKLVVLDIDPHNGKEETRIMASLAKHNFRGILVLDDIHLNAQMQAFWDAIAMPKIDVTSVGHWSGTGLVVYDPDLKINLLT
jgi:hypothetical protein